MALIDDIKYYLDYIADWDTTTQPEVEVDSQKFGFDKDGVKIFRTSSNPDTRFISSTFIQNAAFRVLSALPDINDITKLEELLTKITWYAHATEGFETGTTGWTLTNAVRTNAEANSGIYSVAVTDGYPGCLASRNFSVPDQPASYTVYLKPGLTASKTTTFFISDDGSVNSTHCIARLKFTSNAGTTISVTLNDSAFEFDEPLNAMQWHKIVITPNWSAHTITCDAYLGEALLGTKTIAFTVTISAGTYLGLYNDTTSSMEMYMDDIDIDISINNYALLTRPVVSSTYLGHFENRHCYTTALSLNHA